MTDTEYIMPSYISYAVNVDISGGYIGTDRRGCKLSAITQASRTVYLTDYRGSYQLFASEFKSLTKMPERYLFVHSGNGNLLLLDGHVESARYDSAAAWYNNYKWVR